MLSAFRPEVEQLEPLYLREGQLGLSLDFDDISALSKYTYDDERDGGDYDDDYTEASYSTEGTGTGTAVDLDAGVRPGVHRGQPADCSPVLGALKHWVEDVAGLMSVSKRQMVDGICLPLPHAPRIPTHLDHAVETCNGALDQCKGGVEDLVEDCIAGTFWDKLYLFFNPPPRTPSIKPYVYHPHGGMPIMEPDVWFERARLSFVSATFIPSFKDHASQGATRALVLAFGRRFRQAPTPRLPAEKCSWELLQEPMGIHSFCLDVSSDELLSTPLEAAVMHSSYGTTTGTYRGVVTLSGALDRFSSSAPRGETRSLQFSMQHSRDSSLTGTMRLTISLDVGGAKSLFIGRKETSRLPVPVEHMVLSPAANASMLSSIPSSGGHPVGVSSGVLSPRMPNGVYCVAHTAHTAYGDEEEEEDEEEHMSLFNSICDRWEDGSDTGDAMPVPQDFEEGFEDRHELAALAALEGYQRKKSQVVLMAMPPVRRLSTTDLVSVPKPPPFSLVNTAREKSLAPALGNFFMKKGDVSELSSQDGSVVGPFNALNSPARRRSGGQKRDHSVDARATENLTDVSPDNGPRRLRETKNTKSVTEKEDMNTRTMNQPLQVMHLPRAAAAAPSQDPRVASLREWDAQPLSLQAGSTSWPHQRKSKSKAGEKGEGEGGAAMAPLTPNEIQRLRMQRLAERSAGRDVSGIVSVSASAGGALGRGGNSTVFDDHLSLVDLEEQTVAAQTIATAVTDVESTAGTDELEEESPHANILRTLPLVCDPAFVAAIMSDESCFEVRPEQDIDQVESLQLEANSERDPSDLIGWQLEIFRKSKSNQSIGLFVVVAMQRTGLLRQVQFLCVPAGDGPERWLVLRRGRAPGKGFVAKRQVAHWTPSNTAAAAAR
jgi:hypothetical protein